MSDRVSAGRLNGVHAEVGTVFGPKAITREYVVVTGNDDQGVTVGYARRDDVDDAAIEAILERGPRSVTEVEMCIAYKVRERARLRALFGRTP